MMTENGIKTVCPTSRQQWRAWLQEHHHTEKSVWLIYYKKRANRPTITWSEAVDEALCFGWIDSQAKSLDDERLEFTFPAHITFSPLLYISVASPSSLNQQKSAAR